MSFFRDRRDDGKSVQELTQEKKTEIGQLKKEVAVERFMTSSAIKEMIAFVEANRVTDPILNGTTTIQTQNPFASKKKCTLL